MPGRDGTGPMGQGPRTGRGAGFCRGFSLSKDTNDVRQPCVSGSGRGFRGGFCHTGGRGLRRFSCRQ